MTKQERIDMERTFEQKEREIESNHRLAAAMERLADAQEVNAGYRAKPVAVAPAPVVIDMSIAPLPVTGA